MARVLASELKAGDKLASAGGVLNVLRARTEWPHTFVIAASQKGVSTGWVQYNAHDEFDTITLQ